MIEAAQASDCSTKSAPSSITSATPSAAACFGLSIVLNVKRVLHDHRNGVVRADDPRQQGGSTPTGDESEEDLGKRKGGSGRRDGAVGAVQCYLEPTAHRGAIDEGEARYGQGRELAEHPVPESSDLEHLFMAGELLGRRRDRRRH